MGNVLVELVAGPIDARPLRDFVAAGLEIGAVATFDGITRSEEDPTHGRLHRLEYEAYEPMARELLQQLAVEAQTRWGLARVAVSHRLGAVPVGQVSVMVAVSAAHRAEAFEACRWLIDTLKETVPIWKKSRFSDGHGRWSPQSQPGR